MLLKFGAACRSQARFLGKLHGLAMEPTEKLLLKVVVEEHRLSPSSASASPSGASIRPMRIRLPWASRAPTTTRWQGPRRRLLSGAVQGLVDDDDEARSRPSTC